MNREIMQQALNALLISAPLGHAVEDYEYRHRLIKDIEQELAKPEQEPVAWMTLSEHEYSLEYKFNWLQTPLHDIPLYKVPMRQKWVGLTDEDTANICMQGDLNDWHDEQVIDAVEAKLKEKNYGSV